MGYIFEDSDDDLDESFKKEKAPDASSVHRQMTTDSHGDNSQERHPESREAGLLSQLNARPNSQGEAAISGQGGFGYVHKGVLPNGKEVAVKQLKAGSGQGEREFQAEVEIISRVHHKHLVSLVGYYIAGAQRMLVYEFVPNNTMEFHLHGVEVKAGVPLKVKPEDGRVIHISQAALGEAKKEKGNDIVPLRLKINGKMFVVGSLSGEKFPQVSFDLVLEKEFELSHDWKNGSVYFCGYSAENPYEPLLTRALEDGNYDSLVDARLQRNYNTNVCVPAAVSVCHSARRRPRMSQIVRALEGDVSLSDLNEGIKPGHSTVYNSYTSSDYDTSQYNEDMKKFRKMALGSQEYGASSEYSNPTSDYGLYPSGSSSELKANRQLEKWRWER